jgi:S1-C subfamily serine protease
MPLPKRSDSRKRKGRGGVFLVALVAAIIGALLVLVAFPWAFGVNPWDLVRGKVKNANQALVVQKEKESVKIVSPTQGAMNVAGIARKVIPSVVNIDIRTAPQQNPFLSTGSQEGTGSGVIYSQDGYIITNNHVVQDAQEITVRLAGGQELKGKKVGADPENDIAVVKVDKAGLPAISVGDSDSLVVGELVVAVGSPFGFEQSVTSGIISALHRTVSADSGQGQSTTLTDLIQTDAPINPGNSGGALCDSNARLVGINAVIATASGGSEGVGFAIPIDTAKQVADDLIAGRPVSHPYMGVLGQSITADIATQYGLPASSGAYITQVLANGPAGKAGIKTGDIIVAVDGKPVHTMGDLIAEIRSRDVGSKMSVTYYSGKDKKTADVTLEEKPKNVQ